MPEDGTSDLSADFLQRAIDARGKATCASNYFLMDEYLDIAAAWRALAVEAERLSVERGRPIAFTPRPSPDPLRPPIRPALTLVAVQNLAKALPPALPAQSLPERRERPALQSLRIEIPRR
jgi:hypothetical protein